MHEASSGLQPAPHGPVAPAARLLSPQEEGALFWRLRRWTVGNLLHQSLSQARLRVMLISLLTGLLWLGLFALFTGGFEFLKFTIPDPVMHDDTARAVFSIFFASLTVMLTLSTGIILYGSLYRSSEVRFLMTLPVRVERVFVHKFQEAMLFSSWGFLLLGSPMLVAYGVVESAETHYFAVLLPFMLSFVFIPGSLGAIFLLLLVRWLPGHRRRAAWAAGVAAVAGGAVLLWSVGSNLRGELLTPAWFQEVLARLRFSEARLLPNWWLSSGLLEAARAGWHEPAARDAMSESVLFLALTVSNALFFHQVAVWVAARTFRDGLSALVGERTVRKRHGRAWIDRAVVRCVSFLSPQMRLLIEKDVRLFRRDPMQWLQFLIFFGLLALYFLNIRRLSYDMNYVGWVNMISFLNLAVVGLILSTFTTRFIFPMISLEGRRFWILGLLPVRRETILWSKFLFAAIGSTLPSLFLILLSDAMLGVSGMVLSVHVMVCVILCSGLSAIAVGLGAKMPNLRDDSPSRIAAGFGGTLNLVVSAAYIAAVVVMTAVPCHLYLGAILGMFMVPGWSVEQLWFLLLSGIAASLLLGIAVTVLPMRMGFKAFRELEF